MFYEEKVKPKETGFLVLKAGFLPCLTSYI